MRDEIRQPNKVVWMGVGVVAFLCALAAVFAPLKAPKKALSPPFSLKYFIPPAPPQGFDPDRAHQQVRQHPDDRALWINLQTYYASQGKWEKALEIGKRIVATPSGSREANAYLGIAYALVNLGKPDEAERWVQQGLLKVQDRFGRAQLLRVLGDLYLLRYQSTGQPAYLSRADVYYETALKEYPRVPLAKVQRAYVKFKEGDIQTARALLEQVRQSPESLARERAMATYYLAQIEASQGHFREAEELYARARQLHPESFQE